MTTEERLEKLEKELVRMHEAADRAKRWPRWLLAVVALVVSLFYIGHEFKGVSLMQTADAQVVRPMTEDGRDMLITQSADGQTLYLWYFTRPGTTDPDRDRPSVLNLNLNPMREPSFLKEIKAR